MFVSQLANTQGLIAIDDFATLEEHDIEQMCTNLCRPGGMVNVAYPAFDPNNPVPGVLPNLMVANPGYPIGHIHVKRLKLLRYYVVHLKRTQRAFAPGGATMARLIDLYRIKEIEDEASTIEYPEKLTAIDRVRRTIENIDAYLLQKLGVNGIPLASVTRLNSVPPVEKCQSSFRYAFIP
jgi:hypothetical protein